MKITIQSPGFKATKRLQRFISTNVAKLDSLYQPIVEGQICLRVDNASNGEDKVCELKVAIPGKDLFASRQAVTFEESIVKAITAVKHQIEKLKTKRELKRKV